MEAWFVYALSSIDLFWDHLPTVEDVAIKSASDAARAAVTKFDGDAYVSLNTDAFVKAFRSAQEMATKLGWEGDFSIAPRVLWLPDDGRFVYGFIWRQDNHGSTYVVSPRPLSWLDELSFERGSFPGP
jgi:hypothetical protein